MYTICLLWLKVPSGGHAECHSYNWKTASVFFSVTSRFYSILCKPSHVKASLKLGDLGVFMTEMALEKKLADGQEQ